MEKVPAGGCALVVGWGGLVLLERGQLCVAFCMLQGFKTLIYNLLLIPEMNGRISKENGKS